MGPLRPKQKKYGLILAYKDRLWLFPRFQRFFDTGEISNRLGTRRVDTKSYVPNDTTYEVYEAKNSVECEVHRGPASDRETEILNELLESLSRKREFFEFDLNENGLDKRESDLLDKLKH